MASNSITKDPAPFRSADTKPSYSTDQTGIDWGDGPNRPFPASKIGKMIVPAPIYTGGGFLPGVHPAFLCVVNAINHVMRKHDYVPRKGENWGFCHRKMRGGNKMSIHSYGAALDLSAGANPMAKRFQTDFPPGMVADLMRIKTVADGRFALDCGLFWGLRRPGASFDAMHFQAACSPSSLREGVVTADGAVFTATSKIAAVAPAGQAPSQNAVTSVMKLGAKSTQVQRMQELLIAQGLLAAGTADGAFGPATEDAVKKWQAKIGLKPDGLWGPGTERKTVEHLAAAGVGARPVPTLTIVPADVAERIVHTAYVAELGREPDAEGGGYWKHQVHLGIQTEASLRAMFSATPEGIEVDRQRAEKRVKEAAEAVQAAFMEQFGRSPSDAELTVGITRVNEALSHAWAA